MILNADARRIPLAAGSVQCVVTSPPYWGLRDYGTGAWEGGDSACGHYGPRSSLGPTGNKGWAAANVQRDSCLSCGAWRIDRQIGLEPTPDEYVATMVGVFREVWRVLRDDGTLWLNLGDSYAAGGRGGSEHHTEKMGLKTANAQALGAKRAPDGLKPKDLCGMPWRVAFALQADGWYLRSDIIWAKSNPMPESVTDRPTRSHEYLFLLSKSERYFYDATAIQEPVTGNTHSRGPAYHPMNKTAEAGSGIRQNSSWEAATWGQVSARNKRSVWTVNSEPTPEAHFATFPQKLIEPCILAGSRPGDICFDPFLGSGTVGKVCERLGRRWVGLELSEPYIEIAKDRTAQMGLGI